MIKFDRSRFHKKKNKISTSDIKHIIKDLIIKNKIKKKFVIDDISSLNNLKENSILFLENDYPLSDLNIKNMIFITDSIKSFEKSDFAILVSNLNISYSLIINYLYEHEDTLRFEDNFSFINNSYISEKATIHRSSKISNNCTIGKGVIIGKNCLIKNNVVIKNSIIGNNVIIGDNTSIGTTGFGFDLKNMGAPNILPQIGIVFIEDNVRIGSNCTIDRAKIDTTFIGKNTMIDNLVHIAHNVVISKNACIAAQTGISGSTVIGENLIVGGQSGFSGHLKVGNNVVVAAKSGVTKNIKDKSIVAGFPATDINKWKKMIIKQRKDGHK